ncbi:LicD family protein [Thermophagus sp. OGC60D27]|uniref:LicD family protein n=1 Tax=Thermophagus sp. OGC60D27 TaxID=3458415 RepID=UPI0040384CF1
MAKTGFDFRNKKNHRTALLFFLKLVDVLDHFDVPYFLEGGTLLGVVRDRNLLPWDHDIDFSINHSELKKLRELRWHFFLKGYKLSVRKSRKNIGPFKKGDVTVIKVKPILPYLAKEWIFFGKRDHVVCDIFVKQSDGEYHYWQAKEKIMRVSNKYHDRYDSIEYLGRDIMVPSNYKDYLTEKFGDWSVPVKEWDCAKNEKTIVDLAE